MNPSRATASPRQHGQPRHQRQHRLRARTARVGLGALIGALTAGVALAAGEAIAIFTGPASAPVFAVGEAAVNLTPAPLKEWAIAHFGEHDKQLLIAGILVLLAVIALLAGILALRRYPLGAALVGLFGAIGVAAAVSPPDSTWTWALPSVVGALVAMAALRLLVGTSHAAATTGAVSAIDGSPWELSAPPAVEPHGLSPETAGAALPGPAAGRRDFLLAAGGVAAGSAAVGFGANLISDRRYDVAAERAAVRIPRPTYPAPPAPAGVHPDIPGLSPFYTDNDVFYRVDTDLVLPEIDPNRWTLRIDGMVEHPIELSFADLLKRPLHEHDMTISCVSDPVGGPYVGNARWIGVSVPDLLHAAGLQSGADQLIARSAEGMTIGTPLESVLDGRNALLAVAMNGQALPIAHGFPARMLIPGFYGYASACKWVTELTVTTFAAQQAYWVRRGYAEIGTMKTQSRIDVPKPFAHLNAGNVTVAGVAWATDRGIADVEVQIDDGPWRQARLAASDGPDTWRQWTYEWQATTGTHAIQVRAADDSGTYQSATRAEPYPSGASGYESLVVIVA
ncbi:molybdopterin-dependent oxidoreductase [Actinospica durhamensis]|uniref:Molybdopterin-dependent oxidoreductase n=1 Tax=Actinospica durhamensis TaxID=1508375 RepID=A0A941EQ04_9ACTN|nr:molybdopterin-dependent oxidoreductase [Actinospica durhamensis]MBR7835013.1 molybdopterin-dependent oxidoreductase [Actinospica durhamensis]